MIPIEDLTDVTPAIEDTDEDDEADEDGVFRQLVSLKNKSCMDFQISCKDELKVVSCKICKCRLTSFM